MIYEYAIQPEVIYEAAKNKGLANHLITHFKHGGCCRFSHTPHKWRGQLGELLATKREAAENKKPKEQAKVQALEGKVVEIAQKLTSVAIKRQHDDFNGDWMECILREHNKHEFQSMLLAQRAETPSVISVDNILDSEILSQHEPSILVPKTLKGLLSAIKPVLQNSTQLTLVDPYFFPIDEYTSLLEGMFELIEETAFIRTNKHIEVVVFCAEDAGHAKRYVPENEFRSCCEEQWRRIVPEHVQLSIVRLAEKEGKERLHNRYLLTDIGGIVLPYGFNLFEGDGQFDDVSVMSAAQFTKRRAMYSLQTREFAMNEEPIVLSATSSDR